MSDTIAVTETTGKITCRWAWVNVNLEKPIRALLSTKENTWGGFQVPYFFETHHKLLIKHYLTEDYEVTRSENGYTIKHFDYPSEIPTVVRNMLVEDDFGVERNVNTFVDGLCWEELTDAQVIAIEYLRNITTLTDDKTLELLEAKRKVSESWCLSLPLQYISSQKVNVALHNAYLYAFPTFKEMEQHICAEALAYAYELGYTALLDK